MTMDRTVHAGGSLQASSGIALIIVLVLAGLATGASAHAGSSAHGSLTFHDAEQAQAASSSQGDPLELSCEFWVRGYDMSHANGTILATHDPDDREAHTHELGTWAGAENASGGWDFKAGPFTLHAEGDWLVQASAGEADHTTEAHEVSYEACEDEAQPLPGEEAGDCEGPPDVKAFNDGTAIVVDWEPHQDPDDTAHYDVYRSEDGERNVSHVARIDGEETTYRDHAIDPGTTYVYYVTGTDEGAEAEGEPCDHARVTSSEHRAPPCPQNVRAEAREEGEIALSWKAVDGADTYKVYRSTSETEFYQIATVQDPGHVDPDTEEETTYEYRVSAANEVGQSERCPRVEATAIPSFPTGVAIAAAAIGGAGAILALRGRL